MPHHPLRPIADVLSAHQVGVGTALVDELLPSDRLTYWDPFLLFHHWKETLAGGQRQREVGVGPHPHRGFSPVTLVLKGGVHHRDSFGHSCVVYDGGAQWMHAGKGITHSERPAKELAAEGGDFEIIQFWINEPRSVKMTQATYQPVTAAQTPVFKDADGQVEVAVLSGEYQNIKGAVSPVHPTQVLRIKLQLGAIYYLPTEPHHNLLLYVADGWAEINGHATLSHTMLAFAHGSDGYIRIVARQVTELVLLSSEPIHEPYVKYGSFVMNHDDEILHAMRDAQMGKMGILIEDFD